MKIYRGMAEPWDSNQHATALRTALAADTGSSVPADVVQAAKTLIARIDTVAGNAAPSRGPGSFRRGGSAAPPNLVQINGTLGGELNGQDLADAAPTAATLAAFAAACQDLKTAVTAWHAIRDKGLAEFNALLSKDGLTALTAPAETSAIPSCGGEAAPLTGPG